MTPAVAPKTLQTTKATSEPSIASEWQTATENMLKILTPHEGNVLDYGTPSLGNTMKPVIAKFLFLIDKVEEGVCQNKVALSIEELQSVQSFGESLRLCRKALPTESDGIISKIFVAVPSEVIVANLKAQAINLGKVLATPSIE